MCVAKCHNRYTPLLTHLIVSTLFPLGRCFFSLCFFASSFFYHRTRTRRWTWHFQRYSPLELPWATTFRNCLATVFLIVSFFSHFSFSNFRTCPINRGNSSKLHFCPRGNFFSRIHFPFNFNPICAEPITKNWYFITTLTFTLLFPCAKSFQKSQKEKTVNRNFWWEIGCSQVSLHGGPRLMTVGLALEAHVALHPRALDPTPGGHLTCTRDESELLLLRRLKRRTHWYLQTGAPQCQCRG